MSPDKIRDLLQAACPELTWVLNGQEVCAGGTLLHVSTDPAWGQEMLWLGRGASSPKQVWPDPVGLRNDVWRALSKREIRTSPGARLLDASMRAQRARFDLTVQIAREEAARQELATQTAILADARATAAAAEAALAKAEAHAAKVTP